VADYILPELPLLPAGVPVDWPLPPDLTDDGLEAALDIDSLEAAIGLAMHRLLEWQPAGEAGYGDAQQAAAAREFKLDAAQAAEASALAHRIRQGEGRWAWDDAEIDWHGSEVPIAWQGASLRIDRLVRRRGSGDWWVLDYKSALRPERQPQLRAQLAAYRAAVMAASPGETVHAAFLTGQGTMVVLAEDMPSAGQNTVPAHAADEAPTGTLPTALAPSPMPGRATAFGASPPSKTSRAPKERKPPPPSDAPDAPGNAQAELF